MGAVDEVLDKAFYIPPKIIICWATFIFKGDDLTFAHYI